MVISMEDIYQQGTVYSYDAQKTIYLTPEEPLVFDVNKWAYKQMPTIKTWKKDMLKQFQLHKRQGSNHLAFTFPENESLEQKWMDELKSEHFELGIMELYAIESTNIKQRYHEHIEVSFVHSGILEDYIEIYKQFAEPYGKAYAEESIKMIRSQFNDDQKSRLIAYDRGVPVGILDLILTDKTAEIDGFGVLERYQNKGIGSIMQSFVANVAGPRPIILIADGEDSAKHMYIKQGYIFISFCYQILKENVD